MILATIGIFAELYGDSLPGLVKHILFVMVIAISVQVFFVQFYRPALVNDEKFRQIFIGIIFERMLIVYQREHPGDYDLRANVMRMRTIIGFPRHLQISYHTGDYSAAELDQRYGVGVGCCGWAYEVRDQTFFDKVSNQMALREMTPAQIEATQHVHCILSTPIFREEQVSGQDPTGEPIGILNLDSRYPIDKTGFDQRNMQDLVAAYATLIGTLL